MVLMDDFDYDSEGSIIPPAIGLLEGPDDDSDDSDAEDPDSFLCDAGPLLADAALLIGAHVACPFIVNGIQVHCPGILGARRASDMHWKVAFYDGDTWFVRRDRLFAVVDLAAA